MFGITLTRYELKEKAAYQASRLIDGLFFATEVAWVVLVSLAKAIFYWLPLLIAVLLWLAWEKFRTADWVSKLGVLVALSSLLTLPIFLAFIQTDQNRYQSGTQNIGIAMFFGPVLLGCVIGLLSPSSRQSWRESGQKRGF